MDSPNDSGLLTREHSSENWRLFRESAPGAAVHRYSQWGFFSVACHVSAGWIQMSTANYMAEYDIMSFVLKKKQKTKTSWLLYENCCTKAWTEVYGIIETKEGEQANVHYFNQLLSSEINSTKIIWLERLQPNLLVSVFTRRTALFFVFFISKVKASGFQCIRAPAAVAGRFAGCWSGFHFSPADTQKQAAVWWPVWCSLSLQQLPTDPSPLLFRQAAHL